MTPNVWSFMNTDPDADVHILGIFEGDNFRVTRAEWLEWDDKFEDWSGSVADIRQAIEAFGFTEVVNPTGRGAVMCKVVPFEQKGTQT